jgi:CRISPR-associated protein Cas1
MDQEVLPARMVNEFVYCPRLFYLEWVAGHWADSDDTVEGAEVHSSVDSGVTQIRSGDAGRIVQRRGLRFESPDLGLSCRLDTLECFPDGTARIVEVKKGLPPEDGVWPTDLAQVLVQVRLARAEGWEITEAVVGYSAGQVRRAVTLDEDAEAWLDEVITGARGVAGSDVPPPPLVDSPKCARCSLRSSCLPDEVAVLSGRRGSERPLAPPARDERRPLYVDAAGAAIGVRGGRLEVRSDGETLASVRIIDLTQLCVRTSQTVSGRALETLFRASVPVCWFGPGWRFVGLAHGLPSRHVGLRRSQYLASDWARLEIARSVVAGKITNQRTLLMRNSRRRDEAAIESLRRSVRSAANAGSVEELLGIEGAAARTYFGQFASMLADPWSAVFAGRRRRPPTDEVNAVLSFVYGLLVKDLTVQLSAIGLDPYAGVLHTDRHGQPSLALDLMEEFRPLVADSVTVGLFNNGELSTRSFMVDGGAVSLSREGRRTVLEGYERRMATEFTHPQFGYRVSWRRALEIQARLLAARLQCDIDAYVPVRTR